jgi:DNA-binding transcriptional MerR regulator
MGVLDQIAQMRRERKTDEEIIASLREQGISPKAINEALNQEKIKSAVSDVRQMGEGEEQPYSPSQNTPPPSPTSPNQYAPGPQEGYGQQAGEVYPPQAQQEQEYYPQYQQPAAEYYPQQPMTGEYQDYGYTSPGGFDADTMMEISEQVFSEKIRDIKKQLEDLSEFKTLTQTKLENALDRLKKIEDMMNKLQIAILEKVGSYGSNLESIKKEMSMMQDSFKKMIPSLAKKIGKRHATSHAMKKISHKKKSSKKK